MIAEVRDLNAQVANPALYVFGERTLAANGPCNPNCGFTVDELEKMAARINATYEAAVMHEREACANIADSVVANLAHWKDFEIAEDIARRIRERGKA